MLQKKSKLSKKHENDAIGDEPLENNLNIKQYSPPSFYESQKVNLPYLIHARKAFFETLLNDSKLESQEAKNCEQQDLESNYDIFKQGSANKASVYKIQYNNQAKVTKKVPKIHLNSTYRKMIMNSNVIVKKNFYQTRYYKEIKQSQNINKNTFSKYNTVQLSVQRPMNQMFCPRANKKDLSRKKSELMQEYLNKYTNPNQKPKNIFKEDNFNLLNKTLNTIVSDRQRIKKLEKLHGSLQTKNIENMKFQYLPKQISIKYKVNKQAKASRYSSINQKPKKKKESINDFSEKYGPWDNNPEIEEISFR